MMSRNSTAMPGAIRATLRASLLLVMILAVALWTPSLAAQSKWEYSAPTLFGDSSSSACSSTAVAAFNACKMEVRDDYWEALGICFNQTEGADDCIAEASEERFDSRAECGEQLVARREICDELGEEPYDPSWEGGDHETCAGSDFACPGDFNNDNPYLPLMPGNSWVYEDGEQEEELTVEVFGEYKLIDGVWCIVVNDTGEVEDEEKEATDDWMALKVLGNEYSIHYCGEISQDFEWMEFDLTLPDQYELVAIEGSWKAGRDGAKSGILMPGEGDLEDFLGTLYRQEWAFGDAEDMGELVAIEYTWRDGDYEEITDAIDSAGLTGGQELLLAAWCTNGPGCVVTRDFTPIEPDVEEFKFYAYDIGLVLEIDPDPEEGGYIILVGCEGPDNCPGLP